MGEVCAASVEVDDALKKIVEAPHEVEECHKHLSSAIWHLAEAVKSPRGVEGEARQKVVVEELQRKMLRLNKLFRQSQAFYRGWAALAGVDEGDRKRGTVSIQG